MALTVISAVSAQSRPRLPHDPIPLDGVPRLLLRAIRGAATVRLHGVRTVEFHFGKNADHHEEYVTRDGEFVRIEFPSNSKFSGQIIVEDGKERRHYFPDKNEIRVLPPRREEALNKLIRLSKGGFGKRFQIKLGSGEKVAGYPTATISVEDSDGNVVDKIFIEPKTGAVLKRYIFDKAGTRVGMFEFQEVDLHPARFSPELFKIERKGAKVVTPYDNLRRLALKEGFENVYLPRYTGYLLEWVKVQKEQGSPVLIQVYSCDERKLTMFQIKGNLDQAQLNKFVRSEFKVKTWRMNGETFVLMGGHDMEALNHLAKVLGEGT